MAFLIVAGAIGLAVGGLYGASRLARRRDLGRLDERARSLGLSPVEDLAAVLDTDLVLLAPSFEADLDGPSLLGFTPGRRAVRRTAEVLAAWARPPNGGSGLVAMARVKYRVTTRGGMTRDSSAITDDIVIGRLRRSVEGALVVVPAASGLPAGRTHRASDRRGRDGVVAHPTADELMRSVWSVVESQGADHLIATDSRLCATLWSIRVRERDPSGGAAFDTLVPRGPSLGDLHGLEIRGDIIAVGAAARSHRSTETDELISLVEHAIEHI